MKEKTIKFSKAVVKGGCWILKCFIPEWRFQGVLQDALDECAEYITDNMPERKVVAEIMSDDSLRDLQVPESQYELVRQSIWSPRKKSGRSWKRILIQTEESHALPPRIWL